MKYWFNSRGLRTSIHKSRIALSAIAVAAGMVAGSATTIAAPPDSGCGASRWVGSWLMAPSDSLPLGDLAFTPTAAVYNQTYRIVLTPHLGGSTLRLHLSARQSPLPFTFASVTVAKQQDGPAIQPDTIRKVTFGGSDSVTAAAGSDLVSDPIALDFEAFEPLAVSIYVPGMSIMPTENVVGLSTSYYGAPGSGDHAYDADGAALTLHTTSVLFATGMDVLAPAEYSSVIAMGDSITTGYAGASYYEGPQDPAIVDRNLRYMDFLQRRFDASGTPMVALHSAIWGNRVIRNATIPHTGPGAGTRLQKDVIDTAGVSDVIIASGTNDLAFPPAPTVEQLSAAYIELIDRLHAAGIRVHLATIPPSVRSWIAGGLAPFADPARQQVNAWIRSQTYSDTVIDFDAVLRDPNDPAAQRADLVSPTLVHPNPAGHRAMAEAIDIATLQGSRCR
ncbi:GDSL-type esterase/lipase family protein [Nocardia sp. NPDC050710]|uniref:GDSL-type esterase/lipase family protein n=1 Tax=Nocardia sp. NPDC050710 TaxID=3157220 RepID=UPI0033C89595